MNNSLTTQETALAANDHSRRFVTCSVLLVVLLALSKGIGVYTGIYMAVYILPPLLWGIFLLSSPSSRDWLRATALVLLVLATAALIANAIPDPTWDGNMYHKVAIVALHDGWNPWVFPNFIDWTKTRSEIYYSAAVWQGNSNALWISNYPNLSWLVGSALMDFGFGWESGKALSILLAIALYVYARSIFRQYVSKSWTAELLAFLTVLCQPLLAQLMTNYVDGATYASSSLCVLCVLDKRRGIALNSIAWGALIILAGLKFTGALYGVLLAIPFILLRRPSIREIIIWTLIGAATLSHPYLNHIISGVKIGYPVTGNNIVLQGQADKKLLQESRTRALVDSLLSKTSNSIDHPGHKIPGTVYDGEIIAAGVPDARYAGFGPLFSLALIIGIAALIVTLTEKRSNSGGNRDFALLIGGTALLFALTLVHPALWWARFVPFLYLGLILCFTSALQSTSAKVRILTTAGLGAMLLNGTFVILGTVSYVRDHSIQHGVSVNREIARKYERNDKLIVRAPQFVAFSALYNLQHTLDIPVTEYQPTPIDSLSCTKGHELGFWIDLAKICAQPTLSRTQPP